MRVPSSLRPAAGFCRRYSYFLWEQDGWRKKDEGNYSAWYGRDERLCFEYSLQRAEHVPSLLANRRDVAPYSTEPLRSSLGSKTSRDLLLYFDHPNVPLGLVVVEW